MPLHADAEAVLQSLEEAGVPPLDALPPLEARQVFHAAFATPPEAQEPLARVEDRVLEGPGGALAVRLYAPAAPGPLPALLHFHGGGWVICDLDTHDGFCRSLANAAGCAVVSVDYRLAPEHRFPAAAEDCYAALCRVAEQAAELGVDPQRLGVIGDSAGGNLAAAVTLMSRDREGPPLCVQILTYPALDATMAEASIQENAKGYFLTESAMRWFWGHYLGESADPAHPYASPLHAGDLSRLPPALIVTAEYDPLRDEGEAYARRLAEAAVPATLRRYEGVFHGFVLMANAIAAGREALELEARFVRDAFAGGALGPGV